MWKIWLDFKHVFVSKKKKTEQIKSYIKKNKTTEQTRESMPDIVQNGRQTDE